MSPEAQRIAIAEACGWRLLTIAEAAGLNLYTPSIVQDLGWVVLYCGEKKMGGSRRKDKSWGYWIGFLPDYLADLNAMHEAWLTLTDSQKFQFRAEQTRVVMADFASGKTSDCWQEGATAAQRAEAFLRTIGKWQDSPHPAPILEGEK